MELGHLETFLAVYRAGNITKAASALHLSQPAVSAQIKSIEAELGRALFIRLHRGVAPTPFAHALAERVSEPIDTLRSAGTVQSPIDQSTLLLGGPADALALLVLPALAPLVDRGLKIEVRFGLPRELTTALGEGGLDLAITTTPSRHRSVALEPMYVEALVLVGSPRLRVDATTVTATHGASLEALPLVSFAANAPLVRRYWREVFGRNPPRPAVIVEDLRAVATLVHSGQAWSVLPDYMVNDNPANGLQVLHRPASAPTNTLYLATRQTARPQPHITEAVRAIRAALPPLKDSSENPTATSKAKHSPRRTPAPQRAGPSNGAPS